MPDHGAPDAADESTARAARIRAVSAHPDQALPSAPPPDALGAGRRQRVRPRSARWALAGLLLSTAAPFAIAQGPPSSALEPATTSALLDTDSPPAEHELSAPALEGPVLDAVPEPAEQEGAAGQQATNEDSSLASIEAEVATADSQVAEPSAEEEVEAPTEPNPCVLRPGERGMWLDAVQRGIFTSVCSSARWFDGFFGDQRYNRQLEQTWGQLGIDTVYDKVESVKVDVDFRAEVQLPNLDNRFNAFFGRDHQDDYLSGRNEGVESLPQFFRDGDDRDWLAGLGYRPAGDASSRFDIKVGVKLRFPLEPFVQGSYRKHVLLSETRLLRFRNIVFWRNQHGFGDTISFDAEQALGQQRMLRFAYVATLSEATEGVDWRNSLTLYQSLPGPRAMAFTAYSQGETDAPVTLERYGLRTIYRQRMFRDWFFGELILGVNWPRPESYEHRQASWEAGFGFEIRYGREPD